MDATALLAGLQLMLPESCTTPLVASEVRDAENRAKLELAVSLGRLRVVEPPAWAIRRARSEAAKLGELTVLSDADLSLAALALALSKEGARVVVHTDDYALQNLLAQMGLEYKPLRTTGIRRVWRSRLVCPACGYEAKRPTEKVCPRCGHKLVARRDHRSA